MNQTTYKLCAFVIILGAFLVFIHSNGIAVTSDQTNSVNLQATVNASIKLNKALLAGKELVGVAGATNIGVVTYDASVANDYTAGADFTADDGTKFKNFFNGVKSNACVAVSHGIDFDQFGQAGLDNRASYIGAPPTDETIKVDTLVFANAALGALGNAASADFAACDTGSLGAVSGAAGLQQTDSGGGAGTATAETAVRSATSEIGITSNNLKNAGTRTHPLQVKIEAVTNI